jgi:hypothetical protein
MDALQLKIKALLEESRTMQASIKQLTVQEESSAHAGIFSDHPVVLGLEGLLLGAAALCLGGLLGTGFAWRRMQAVSAPHPADFGESIYSFRSTDDTHHPAAQEVQESNSPPVAPVLEQPHAAPDAVEVDLDAHFVPSTSLFAPAESGSGFDVEAAASEVQRVRRSLADKRAARDRWNANDTYQADDALPPDDDAPDMLLPLDFDLEASVDQELDIDLDSDVDIDIGVDVECAPTPEPAAQTPAVEAVCDIPPELEDVIALDAVENTDGEADQGPGVKLELAQEFLSLGLLDGAREFAMEFMDSTEAPLHSQAMTLISQIDAQEQQEKERVQQAKIQAQLDLAAMFASLPTQ